jgi:ribosomal protein S27AE
MKHLIPHLQHEPRKGTWWRNAGKTLWGCPQCGQAHILQHNVNEEGIVLPSVICGKCGYHDWIVLDEVAPECISP